MIAGTKKMIVASEKLPQNRITVIILITYKLDNSVTIVEHLITSSQVGSVKRSN